MQMDNGHGIYLLNMKNGNFCSLSSFPDSRIYLWDTSYNLKSTKWVGPNEPSFLGELKDGKLIFGYRAQENVTVFDFETNEMKYI